LSEEPTQSIVIEFASSPGEIDCCHAIRRAVFVVEKGIPPGIEFDGDRMTQSVLAFVGRVPVGTARIVLDFPDLRLGRVAVLERWRGLGIGRALVEACVAFARKRLARSVVLHSQSSVVPFYEKLGFVVEGDEYLEAGIPHRTMRMVVQSTPVDGL
jgi:predicted GNAT family N-acyltransferase